MEDTPKSNLKTAYVCNEDEDAIEVIPHTRWSLLEMANDGKLFLFVLNILTLLI
jgi:hypothetical protein